MRERAAQHQDTEDGSARNRLLISIPPLLIWSVVAHSTKASNIGDGLEEADQDSRNRLIVYNRKGFGHWKGEIPLTKPIADRPSKTYADKLLGRPADNADLAWMHSMKH